MTKVRHSRKAYPQGSMPNCGICAIANGLYSDHKKSKDKKYVVYKLWEDAIDNNLSKGDTDDQLKYSMIGDFFSSKLLRSFLREHEFYFPNKVIEDISLVGEKYPVKGKSVLLTSDQKLKEELNNPEDHVFYLVPINPGYRYGYKKNIFHWICVRKSKSKLDIFNDNIPAEKKALCCSHKKIRTVDDLLYAYEKMNELEGDIDMHQWAKHFCNGMIRWKFWYPKNVRNNFKYLSRECKEWSLENKNLQVIKVKYAEK